MHLFSEFEIRKLKLKNRIFVSPMCQYSSEQGDAADWHLVHLGSMALGGAALVMTEATAVEPIGRITPGCLGLWNPGHAEKLKSIVDFVKSQGAAIGIQLAHAGRKGSHAVPWEGGRQLSLSDGGWVCAAPSENPFREGGIPSHAVSSDEISALKLKFVESAKLAIQAGFDVIELHAAHGYLMHQFLSPLSNQRIDDYGGELVNRMRFTLEVAEAVRQVMPAGMPLFVRISATDWVERGWDPTQSVTLCRELKKKGVDLIDVSSGGLSPLQKISVGPHYQVPFSKKIRREASIATGAVGMITDPAKANEIILNGDADAVLLAREMLRDPHWPLRAAHVLRKETPWPVQYERGKWD